MVKLLKKHMKIIKTCNLYLSLFTLGLSHSLTGPCLLDLQDTVHTDTQHIAMIYTARSSGYIVGAIFGGILLDLVKSKMGVLTGCNLLLAASMFGIPWSRNVTTLLSIMVVKGISLGVIETGCNAYCLYLWEKNSDPLFQGMHLAFGIGSLISPLIAVPFLDSARDPLLMEDNSTYLEKHSFEASGNILSNITNATEKIPKIVFPFSIAGAIALSVAILHLYVCISSPTEDRQSSGNNKVDNSDKSCSFIFATAVLTFLLFFVILGTQVGFGQALTTYAVKGRLHLTSTIGSYITSAFWTALTLSRLACVFLAIKVRSFVLLVGDIGIITISALILLFLTTHEWALWLASVLFGMGIASGYASLVGWVGMHIKINNKFSAVFTIGAALGEMIIPFIITYFLDSIPQVLAFVVAASCILNTFFVILLFFVLKKIR